MTPKTYTVYGKHFYRKGSTFERTLPGYKKPARCVVLTATPNRVVFVTERDMHRQIHARLKRRGMLYRLFGGI